MRCRKQQRPAVPDRNLHQRKYAVEESSSSEDESESISEEEFDSDEMMEDTVSEEVASESVSFENHGEASKAQTR